MVENRLTTVQGVSFPRITPWVTPATSKLAKVCTPLAKVALSEACRTSVRASSAAAPASSATKMADKPLAAVPPKANKSTTTKPPAFLVVLVGVP